MFATYPAIRINNFIHNANQLPDDDNDGSYVEDSALGTDGSENELVLGQLATNCLSIAWIQKGLRCLSIGVNNRCKGNSSKLIKRCLAERH